jgi:hypothetical protein
MIPHNPMKTQPFFGGAMKQYLFKKIPQESNGYYPTTLKRLRLLENIKIRIL